MDNDADWRRQITAGRNKLFLPWKQRDAKAQDELGRGTRLVTEIEIGRGQKSNGVELL